MREFRGLSSHTSIADGEGERKKKQVGKTFFGNLFSLIISYIITGK
jgi:hypothetical protein